MTSSPLLSDLAADFNTHLRAGGRADRTQVIHGQAIRFFSDWLAASGRRADLAAFDRPTIEAWAAHLLERGLERSTVATRLRSLRRFARWLHDAEYTEAIATEGIVIPDATDRPPAVLSDEQIAALLALCKTRRGRVGEFDREVFDRRRDELIIRVLVDCGLRVSELVGLALGDVDRRQEVVYVVGKGSRPRVVPFSPQTAECIDRYTRMRTHHPRAPHTDRLLLGERGPMSADGVRWRFEVLGEAAGITGLHPHSLRHSFAHRWLEKGGQERDLKQLAGWRSDTMLEVYGRSMAIKRAQDAHRRLRREKGL